MASKNERRSEELDLERYGHIMAHLRYDQTVLWTRFAAVLAAQIAVYQLFRDTFQDSAALGTSEQLTGRLPYCIVGILLACLWYHLFLISDAWVEKWITRLKELEPSAYGKMDLFSTSPINKSARKVAKRFFYLYCLLWAVSCWQTYLDIVK